MDERRERVLKRVEKYIIQRKYDQAIEILKPLVSQDTRNITLLNMMANTCDLAGKKYLALKYFNESADVYNESSFYSRAIAVLKKVAKIDPSDPEPFEKIANIYLTQSNLNEASSFFREAANLLRKSENPERAVNLFYKALELDPSNQRLRMELIETYKELGQKNEAVEHYLIFVEDFIKRADLQGAKTILENILKLDPNHITALTKLAEICSGLGDKDQTLALYQRIFSIERDNPETLFSFANEYFKRFRDAENAANMLKKAHRLDPENLRILITLKSIVPNDLEVRQALKVYYLEQGDRRKAIMEIMSMADIFAMAKNDKMATKLREKATEMLKELDLAAPQDIPPLRQKEQVVSLDTVAKKAEAGSGVQLVHEKAAVPIPQEVEAVDLVIPDEMPEAATPESYKIITEQKLESPEKLETPPVQEPIGQIVELVSEEPVAVETKRKQEPEKVVETEKMQNAANIEQKPEPAHYEIQTPDVPVMEPAVKKKETPLRAESPQITYHKPEEQSEASPPNHMAHGEQDYAPEAFDAVVPLPYDVSEEESVFIDDVDIDPDTLTITVQTTKITDEIADKDIKPKTKPDDEIRFSPEAVEYAKDVGTPGVIDQTEFAEDTISDVPAFKTEEPQKEIPPHEPVAELSREELEVLQSSFPRFGGKTQSKS